MRLDRKILNVGFHGHSPTTFIDKADGKPKLKLYSFPAESLEMGVYLNPNTFISEVKYTESINFTINIEFGVQAAQQINLFKLEIGFKDIDGEFHTVLDDSQEQSCGTITIANKFPARYWILNKRSRSKDKFNWCFDDFWMRKTEILVSPKSPEEKELPLQSQMPDYSEQLGKWVVFRIKFDLDQLGKTPVEGVGRFTEMIKKAGEYNLISKHIMKETKPLDTIDGANLRKHVDYSMLKFDVLHMVECNLLFNYLHYYNINEDFFSLLSQQPTQTAINLLEMILRRRNVYIIHHHIYIQS